MSNQKTWEAMRRAARRLGFEPWAFERSGNFWTHKRHAEPCIMWSWPHGRGHICECVFTLRTYSDVVRFYRFARSMGFTDWGEIEWSRS